MRTTIVFLSLLVLMSCTKIDSYDTALLELSSNPSSEAIFATIALQLKADANEGFDRVLGLLNELVDDGRNQIHEANKLYRATAARCDVSQMKFNERQFYYDNRQRGLADEAVEAGNLSAAAADNAAFLSSSSDFVGKFRAQEVTAQDNLSKEYEVVLASTDQAVANVVSAIDSVKNWNAGSASFVQEKIQKITASYLQLHSFKLVVPQSFLQMAASDEQVRTRLLEWLEALRVSFVELRNEIQDRADRTAKIASDLKSEIDDLLALYETDAQYSREQKLVFAEQQNSLNEAAALFQKLASDNVQLVAANEEYCRVEKSEYERVKAVLENQLKVFQDIREYFRTNYSKISKFIKDKYGKFQ
jgi:hypothetical protein